LLIDRENLVGDDEDGVEIADCAGFFLINYIDRGAEGFAEDDEIGGDEIEDSEIEDDEIGDGEDGVGIADCEKFFLNHADRCAVPLHSANLVIVIAAVKTASMYRFWVCRINLGSFFNSYF
jgi:hypothetical protein